jgi:anti-anti-sigma factor
MPAVREPTSRNPRRLRRLADGAKGVDRIRCDHASQRGALEGEGTVLFQLEPQASGKHFRAVGELDMSTADVLLSGVAAALADGFGDVVVDVSQLSFVDSSGLRALIHVSRELEGRGRLILMNPTPAVQRLLGLVQADTFPNFEVMAGASDEPEVVGHASPDDRLG